MRSESGSPDKFQSAAAILPPGPTQKQVTGEETPRRLRPSPHILHPVRLPPARSAYARIPGVPWREPAGETEREPQERERGRGLCFIRACRTLAVFAAVDHSSRRKMFALGGTDVRVFSPIRHGAAGIRGCFFSAEPARVLFIGSLQDLVSFPPAL